MADTKRRIKNEEIKKETTEPEAVSQSTAMQERMESVSRKILITARNELYMKMRFLDVALSCMPFIPDTGADGMGTDGLYLYYDPQYLGGLFREDRVMVNRIYLHLVLHGIFRHMLRRKGRADLSSGLRYCGRIHHRRASVPLCDEGQVSSEKRDVPDAEEGNENTDGRTGI